MIVTFLSILAVLFLYLAVKNFLLAVYPEACKLGQDIDHFVWFDVVDEYVRQPQVLKSMVLLASEITAGRSSKYYFPTHCNSFKVILKIIISVICWWKWIKNLNRLKKCSNYWTWKWTHPVIPIDWQKPWQTRDSLGQGRLLAPPHLCCCCFVPAQASPSEGNI